MGAPRGNPNRFRAWEYSLRKVALVFQPEGQTGAKGEQEGLGEEPRNGSNPVSTNVKERNERGKEKQNPYSERP